MATENRKDRRLIEDWSGVTTSVVIPDGQFRWYDGVTGYNAAEVIEMVGDGSTTIASLPKRQPNTDGAQTLYGVKTFDDIPVLPASTPSSDNQATRKAYVDAQIVASLGLPAGYLYGLETEADTDTDHDVIINIGKCRDYDDTTDIEVTTLFTKRSDATYAAGDDNGGMFTGSVAADTDYYLFVIKKDSDDSIDGGWDTDIDCANIPAGYTEYRRIALFKTDSSSNFRPWIQDNDNFTYKTYIVELDTTTPGTSRNTLTLTIPSGLNLISKTLWSLTNSATANVLVTDLATTDMTPASDLSSIRTTSDAQITVATLLTRTNTSSQISYRCTDGTLSAGIRCATEGWIDDRGQHGGK